jgi:quercetin dioxygenase-like cupin family protein
MLSKGQNIMVATSERTITSTPASEGSVYLIGPEVVTIKVPGAETEGTHLVIEIETPAGGGPPLHTHSAKEIFFVIEGEFEFPTVLNGQPVTTRASAGAVVRIPGGIPHSYHNVGTGVGRLLGVLSPAAEMEGFFKEAGILVEDKANLPAPAPFDMERFVAISLKHHMVMLLPTE